MNFFEQNILCVCDETWWSVWNIHLAIYWWWFWKDFQFPNIYKQYLPCVWEENIATLSELCNWWMLLHHHSLLKHLSSFTSVAFHLLFRIYAWVIMTFASRAYTNIVKWRGKCSPQYDTKFSQMYLHMTKGLNTILYNYDVSKMYNEFTKISWYLQLCTIRRMRAQDWEP